MSRRLVGVVVVAMLCWGAMAGSAVAADRGMIRQFGPRAPGIGDPYFPLDGNGGYDVRHYDLDVRYEPSTDVLSGVATIRARPRRTSRVSTSTWSA
jgi:hypothetical protein